MVAIANTNNKTFVNYYYTLGINIISMNLYCDFLDMQLFLVHFIVSKFENILLIFVKTAYKQLLIM